SLVGTIKDEDADVRGSAAWALAEQSALPTSAIQSFVDALKDEDTHVRRLAAWALAKQSALPASAIQFLIDALKDDDECVRISATEALQNQCYSLCIAFPRLTEHEMVFIYKNLLFPYSCRRVVSLHLHDNRLCCYTEQGLVRTEPMKSDKEKLITSAFEAVQREAGIYA
ncbi:hypothetical protein EDD11_001941, partial [Mortierella claussenii]